MKCSLGTGGSSVAIIIHYPIIKWSYDQIYAVPKLPEKERFDICAPHWLCWSDWRCPVRLENSIGRQRYHTCFISQCQSVHGTYISSDFITISLALAHVSWWGFPHYHHTQSAHKADAPLAVSTTVFSLCFLVLSRSEHVPRFRPTRDTDFNSLA